MADQLPDFETSDNDGSTVAYSGTATTTFASVPASPGARISGFMFQVAGENVQISADGGTSYFDIPKKGTGAKDVKGEITQLRIKTSSGTSAYSLWVDFEVN